jgi:hypothetical protein
MRRPRYRTTAELAAVHLRDKDHDKPGIIATIPADVIIQIDGESELVSEMVNILWAWMCTRFSAPTWNEKRSCCTNRNPRPRRNGLEHPHRIDSDVRWGNLAGGIFVKGRIATDV